MRQRTVNDLSVLNLLIDQCLEKYQFTKKRRVLFSQVIVKRFVECIQWVQFFATLIMFQKLKSNEILQTFKRNPQKYVVCGPLVQQTFGHKADHIVYVIFQES